MSERIIAGLPRREYLRIWRLKNIDRVRAREARYARKYYRAHWNKVRARKKKYSADKKVAIANNTRRWQDALRRELLAAYGHKCVCCGEQRAPFLTLEHVNHDGASHRRLSNGRVYYDLKLKGFPKDGYTLLCWNCNCATKNGHTCPHKLEAPVDA